MNLHLPTGTSLQAVEAGRLARLPQEITTEPLPKNAIRAPHLGCVLDAFQRDPQLNTVLVRSERPALEELSPMVQRSLSQFRGPDVPPEYFNAFHPSSLIGGMKSYLAGGVHTLSPQDRQFFSALDEEIKNLAILIAALAGKRNADLDVRTGINASNFHCDPAVIAIIKLEGPTPEFLDSNQARYHRGRNLSSTGAEIEPDAKLYWPNNNDIVIFYGIPQPFNSSWKPALPFGIRPGAIHRTGQRGPDKDLQSGMLLSDLKNPRPPVRNFDILVYASL